MGQPTEWYERKRRTGIGGMCAACHTIGKLGLASRQVGDKVECIEWCKSCKIVRRHWWRDPPKKPEHYSSQGNRGDYEAMMNLSNMMRARIPDETIVDRRDERRES